IQSKGQIVKKLFLSVLSALGFAAVIATADEGAGSPLDAITEGKLLLNLRALRACRAGRQAGRRERDDIAHAAGLGERKLSRVHRDRPNDRRRPRKR